MLVLIGLNSVKCLTEFRRSDTADGKKCFPKVRGCEFVTGVEQSKLQRYG